MIIKFIIIYTQYAIIYNIMDTKFNNTDFTNNTNFTNNTDFTNHNVFDNSIISYDEMGDYISYTCNITKSYIVFEKNKNTQSISINNSEFDWNEPKLTLNLLNYSLNDIITKNKNNIKYFIHIIMKDEQNLMDMTKWEIIKDDGIILDLRCNIDNCAEYVLHGFVAK